ncbi:hypothetical protein WT08_00975 [Burkholderia sp. MSMB1552]|nr:hypothetical protein WT08_00975 [Burkholderia sp. MSMB1552]KWZ56312.1 hypothetical protein WS92_10695 [Burkholderia sp. MSMB1588]
MNLVEQPRQWIIYSKTLVALGEDGLQIGPVAMNFAGLVIEVDHFAWHNQYKPIGCIPCSARSTRSVQKFVSIKLFHPVCFRVEPAVASDDDHLAGQVHALGKCRRRNQDINAILPSEQRLVKVPLGG